MVEILTSAFGVCSWHSVHMMMSLVERRRLVSGMWKMCDVVFTLRCHRCMFCIDDGHKSAEKVLVV